jgi:hypothetical protein
VIKPTYASPGTGAVLGKTDQEVAYRAGMWAMAAIHGNARAMAGGDTRRTDPT